MHCTRSFHTSHFRHTATGRLVGHYGMSLGALAISYAHNCTAHIVLKIQNRVGCETPPTSVKETIYIGP